MAKKQPSYREAAQEIETILTEIEDDEQVDIDQLADKVERAAALIQLCSERLQGAEQRVRKITETIELESEKDDNPDDAAGAAPQEDEDTPF